MPRDLAAPAIVIAHGAWADATSWREVIALLQAKGLLVVAVQSPLTALADDVDAVTRALNHQAHPVVLVGHDYGGTVITQAGRDQTVAALVYIAACAPEIGESTADAQGDRGARAVTGSFTVDAAGFLYLAPNAVLEFLAHDLTATEAAVLAAAQKPIRASALLDRVTDAAWYTRPCWYGVADEDRLFAPALQRETAQRINASVVSLRAGPSPISLETERDGSCDPRGCGVCSRPAATPMSSLPRHAIGSRRLFPGEGTQRGTCSALINRTAVDA